MNTRRSALTSFTVVEVDPAVAVEVGLQRAVDAGLRPARAAGAVRHDVDLLEVHAGRRRLDGELERVARAAQRRRVGGAHVVRQVHEHPLAGGEGLATA